MGAAAENDTQTDAHGRRRVGPDETLEIFRAVAVSSLDDPALVESFRSDAEVGSERFERGDIEYSAISTREQFHQVRDLIRNIARNENLPPYSPDLEVGNYIATLHCTAEHNVLYQRDPPPEGHVSVWGEPAQLAAAVADIQSAWN